VRGKKPRTKYTWRGRSTAASGSGRSILQSQLAMPGKSFFGGSNATFFSLLQFAMLCLAFFASTLLFLLPHGDLDLEVYVRFVATSARGIFSWCHNFYNKPKIYSLPE